MKATRTKIDWDTVRLRLAASQAGAADSECLNDDQLKELFRQRALKLAERGRHEAAPASQVQVIVFRCGEERFGIPIADLSQVFPHVPVTPIPGTQTLLFGVANLNGTLRSVVDVCTLLHTSTTQSEDGHILLLRAAESLLALQVQSIEGLSQIDLASLIAVDEVASGSSRQFMKGITESRIMLLDTAELIRYVKRRGESTR